MSTICTITTESFEVGTAALLNSLHAHGFSGRVFVGHVGSVPKRLKAAAGTLADLGIELVFHTFPEGGLPHYRKPEILLHALETAGDDAVFFIDSDIVICKDWDFFETWIEMGVALCGDVNFAGMGENHPMRYYWSRLIEDAGLSPRRLTGYANSGFIGLKKKDVQFVHTWKRLLELKAERRGGTHAGVANEHGFITIDQDVMNATMMAVDVPLSLVGPEGMSFGLAKGYMTHPVGKWKPWHRGYLKKAIVAGVGPRMADVVYWNNVSGPVEAFSPRERRLARLEMKIARVWMRIF
ncbi:hypothetical protein [Rhodovulum marinum]|uniref:Uncharacterized protein n=1 Tax=Rhodovulum marinum TaxID=320662 RepID=A0A4R2PVL9_9RHOB|nr:hypothetical protein [Rhodovulum marinum]TCP39294.1 hypothetical protein EV662_11371 [Rhodovulum marinum]